MLATVANSRFPPILDAWSKSKTIKKPKERNNNHEQIKRKYMKEEEGRKTRNMFS